MWEFDGELDCFADLMSHWLNVAGRTGMPCDPRLWTASPIAGTYPACSAAEHRLRPTRALTATIWAAA
jgi:hypothetical protein